MTMRRTLATTCACAALAAAGAHAQPVPTASGVAPGEAENDDLSVLRLEELMDLQVKAPTKLPLALRDAPTVGGAIAREQIESYGWISINDVVLRQPGFFPAQDYERLTLGARGVHEGWNNNHLLVLVDGVPHNNNVNLSAYSWEITPLFMVESMEVTRGPGSALYGSTAMNGVVGLNTVSASNDRPADALVRFGNNGWRTYDLLAGHVFAPLSFVVAYNHTESDGNAWYSYDGSGRTDATGALARFPTNDRRSSDYVFTKIEGRGKLAGLELQLHYQYWKFGTGHGWVFYIPDTPESMATNVQNLSLSYRPRALVDDRLQMEWVLMWQRQEVDYHSRFYPASVLSTYPGGLTEVLDNETNSLFARGQVSWHIWRTVTLLGGVENQLFVYTGDHNHQANFDLTTGSMGGTFPGGELRSLPAVLEPVRNRPVDNVGLYLQGSTGRLFRRMVDLTAGLRYDIETFSYVDLTSAARPVHHKTFQQLSPRVALLVHPWKERLVLKAMFERAFRAPAPTELFGANTFFISSNINSTKPEELTTITLAADLLAMRHIDLRLDWYWQKNDNPINFSAASTNLATNLFSDVITGLEAEVLFDMPLSPNDLVGGFFNYTWAHLLDEKVIDVTITKTNVLAWAPEHVFNFGVSFNGHGFGASLQGHFQGRVYRRASDSIDPRDSSISPFAAYRPESLHPWFTLDARVSYRIHDWLRIGVQASNLTDSRASLIKTNRYPFDYQIEGVRVLGTAELSIRPRSR